MWANDEEFLLDYEMLDTFLGIGYGLNHHLGMALIADRAWQSTATDANGAR